MAATAKLKAVLQMDDRQYKAGMKGAQASTKRFQSGLASMGRTLGAAFSVTAVIGLTAKLVTLGSTITDLAFQAGISTDTFQGLEAAALKAGIAPEIITKTFTKLSVVMGQAKSGMKTYLDLFNKVGISAAQLSRMGPEQVFEAIAKTMATSKKGTIEYGAALELLSSKSGSKLLEVMIRVNQVGLKGLIQDARDLGTIIDNQTLQRLDALADRFEIGKKQAAKYGAAIAGAVFELHDVAKELTFIEKLGAVLSGGLTLSGKLGGLFGKFDGTRAESSGRDPADGAAAAAALTAAEAVALSTAEKATQAISDARLKGAEKLKADLVRKEKEIQDKIDKAQFESVKQSLKDQAKLLREHYAEDLEALKKSERDKILAITSAGAERQFKLEDRSEERIDNIRGRGTLVDSFARIGGRIGLQDGGRVAGADRQLQVLKEHSRLQEAIADNTRRTAISMENAEAAARGDIQ